MRRTKTDPTDALIDRAYRRTCSGIMIPMMEIPALFREGRRALAAGEDLEQAIKAFVETIKL